MWTGGCVDIKGWLSFGLYVPLTIRFFAPIKCSLGEENQIKETFRLLVVVFILEP